MIHADNTDTQALDDAFVQFLETLMPTQRSDWQALAHRVSRDYGQGHACIYLPPTSDMKSCPWCQGDNSPLVVAGHRLYLRRAWQDEQRILESIHARIATPMPTSPQLKALLTQLFPSGTDDPKPNWQKIACAMATRGRFTIITGGPGTGKTFTVVRLLALLQALAQTEGKVLHIALSAPTGKAADRLGKSIASALLDLPDSMRAHIPIEAITLHRLLGLSSTNVRFKPISADVIVVDEASMIDLERMAQLMQAIPAQSQIILLGDKDQLASVEAGAVLGQLCEGAEGDRYHPEIVEWIARHAQEDVSAYTGHGHLLAQHTVMLRHSRRFDENSAIGQWAMAVNRGDVAGVKALLNAPDQSVVDFIQLGSNPHEASLKHVVVTAWQAMLHTLRDTRLMSTPDDYADQVLRLLTQFQVLCAMRQGEWGLVALNERIGRWLGFGLQQEEWFAGRPVMVTRNNYQLNLMNGDVGVCLWHREKRALRVAFGTDKGIRWVLPSRLTDVETAFAMTVHKSQGSEFDHTLLVLAGSLESPLLTRELLYTAITRAKTRLTLAVTSHALLLNAVKTRVERAGGLAFDSVSDL